MAKNQIFLKKVKVHNLKGVDLELPTNELIVFTGVSGSGKSSLAFDTLFIEGQRRYIESLSTFARRYLGDFAKPDVESVEGLSPTISIEQKSAGQNPRSTVGTMTEIYDYLRVLYARVAIPHCPVSGEPVMPQSKERMIKKIQNMPAGKKVFLMAPIAKGKKGEFKDDFKLFLRKGYTRARVDGKMIDLSEEISLEKNIAHDVDLIIDRLTLSPETFSRIAEGVVAALELGNGVMSVFDVENEEETLFSMTAYSPKSGLSYIPLEPHDFSFNSPSGMCPTCDGLGVAEVYQLHRGFKLEGVCPTCQGGRLRPYPAAAKLGGLRIHPLCQMDLAALLHFFQNLSLEPTEYFIAEELLKEIIRRLQFLLDVGLHYLALERTAPTLSGGEAQRVRLASQVGCGLVGVTYILDEPSIGLHPRDNKKLIATLKQLRDVGNTVIVVEHDEETIWAADRVVDFGPGPGELGGRILVNGTIQELLEHPESLTGGYLSGRRKIEIPKKRRPISKEAICIHEAEHNNLKKIDATFPLGVLIAVTGVSGSGKSSLITDTLYPALANYLHSAEHPVGKHAKITGFDKIDKIIAIDQAPIGRTPRSNPATYIKIFDGIRQLFSQLPDSVARGFSPGRFSFNVRDGSCPQCHGMGMLRIDMDFLEDQWVPCQTCQNKRFDHETLSVYYKGKNIHDILEMNFSEAGAFFANIPALKRKIDVVSKVGLEYLKLGQSSTTLSGGEAQRIKLAKELVRPGTGRTLYILDEPTTGLHFYDIAALIVVLQELVDRGNTVLVIEHNMDVVKIADWILDIGPEGGAQGGKIVAEGTPEAIAKLNTPTGNALKDVLFPKKHSPRIFLEERIPEIKAITITGAEQNNLKSLDLAIPRGQLTVCTGPSGSGKSSLAFETVYAEGQRRYVESLSPYARQFVRQCPKPKLSQIEGLSPAIAIEQKASAGNPRSTVGTLTEIYDYLRILFAQAGTAYCPETGEEIKTITKEFVAEKILSYPEGEKLTILAPLELQKNEKFEDLLPKLQRQGFVRIRLNEQIYEIDGPIPYDRRRKNEIALIIDRLQVSKSQSNRIYEAVESAALLGAGKVLVLKGEEEVLFNLSFAVESTGKSYAPITPHTFSFNSSQGMCLDCQGLGFTYGANLINNPEIMDRSLDGLLSFLWTIGEIPAFDLFLQKEKIDPTKPLSSLSTAQLQLLLNGYPEEKWLKVKEGFYVRWLGIQPILAKAGRVAHYEIRYPLFRLLDEIECLSCQGSRLNPIARHVRIGSHSIATLCRLPIEETLSFIKNLELPAKTEKVLTEVKKQLLDRLGFLVEVGVEYLSLERRAPTLSNGEAQRIRLARQLGSRLTGVLYVLDEPTIGLHPHDNVRLNIALGKLKELGNTVLMVEHDPQTIATADYLFDFGPGAGTAGGYITAQGTYQEILDNPHSLTGAYLSGREAIEIPAKRRAPSGFFAIENASVHNLKNVSFELPLGVMTCLTGVSGSGKSTLMHQVMRPTFAPLIDKGEPFNKLIVIDQNPIGHTVRSDVGTYGGVLPVLRDFYASLGSARVKGLLPGHFSYNQRKGMCTQCQGLGYNTVEMLFLPSIKVVCEQCHGLRLNPVSLDVTYEGKSFGQLLNMTVDEARAQFDFLPRARRISDTLISVGLRYLKLGQEMASLSGGEAQRMKLARDLASRGTGKTLYLLDEPTTGLHPDDIKKLLLLLHRLVDKGNTMVIIEHNVDVLCNVDHLIDIGPGAGDKGGRIICAGTPEDVAQNPYSLTGKYLHL